MLGIVVTVLLTVHLILVDIAMAGPLVCVWLRFAARRRGDEAADRLVRLLAILCVRALVVGSVLGVLLLGVRYLADSRPYLSGLTAIPADRIWFGLLELVFSFGCLAAYAGLWDRCRARRLLHPLLAIAGSTNLLVHFPSLFAIASIVSTRPEMTAAGPLDRAAYRRMLIDPEVLSRVAHVWLAAAAVAGIVILTLALRPRVPLPEESRRRLFQAGGRLALAATIAQLPLGLWVTLQMPEAGRTSLLGGDWLATGLFLAALVMALHLLHALLPIALGDTEARRARRTVSVLLLVMLLMVGTRVRLASQIPERAGPAPVAAPSQPLRLGAVAFQ